MQAARREDVGDTFIFSCKVLNVTGMVARLLPVPKAVPNGATMFKVALFHFIWDFAKTKYQRAAMRAKLLLVTSNDDQHMIVYRHHAISELPLK